MARFDILVKHTIDVPDDVVNDNPILSRELIQPFVPEAIQDWSIGDYYMHADAIFAPDPSDQAQYEASLAAFETAKQLRDARVIAGSTDEPTDEELEEELVEGVPEPTLICGNCGADSDSFEYQENVLATNDFSGFEDDGDGGGTLSFHGYQKYSDGDSFPGVMCNSCGAALTLPDGVDEDFS